MMINRYSLLTICLSLFSSGVFADDLVGDPTMPAHYKSSQSKTIGESKQLTSTPFEWRLNTTIISPYQKIAVINGKQFKVGDKINGATIERILHQHVILNYQGKKIDLSLQSSFISQINASSHKP